MKELNHPNIISFYSVFETNSTYNFYV